MALPTQRVGGILKGLREQRRLTQATLAQKTKVSRPYIAVLETGTRRNPSLAVVQRLAKALGVPPGDLIG